MLIDKYQPGTFLERGVAVPFTTPMLIGTRARPCQRDGVELIVPNPSGGKGIYLFSWQNAAKFCQLSLHDMALTERVVALKMITPASIRRAASQVAAEGLAGREVAQAAAQSLAHEQQCGLLVNFTLLIALMRQIEHQGDGQVPLERDTPLRLQQRARTAIAAFAPQIGQDGDQVANMLEDLAAMFLRLGVGERAIDAHLPKLARQLRWFCGDLGSWASMIEGAAAEQAQHIVAQADASLRLAEPLLEAAQARSRNVVQLLRDHITAPAKLGAELARPDWLLDGWEMICLRWRTAAEDQREGVVAEIMTMLPAIPDEAQGWGYAVEAEFDRSWLRKVRGGHDWRSGLLAFQSIMRGEASLKLAFEGDCP